jgi:hypothetical protein
MSNCKSCHNICNDLSLILPEYTPADIKIIRQIINNPNDNICWKASQIRIYITHFRDIYINYEFAINQEKLIKMITDANIADACSFMNYNPIKHHRILYSDISRYLIISGIYSDLSSLNKFKKNPLFDYHLIQEIINFLN